MYRQSTENLTKHRLDILKSVKPAGAGVEKEPTLEEVGAYMRYVLNDLAKEVEAEGMKQHVRSEMAHWEQVPWPKEIQEINPGQSPSAPPVGSAGGARDILPEQTEDQATTTTKDQAVTLDHSVEDLKGLSREQSVSQLPSPRPGKLYREMVEEAGTKIVLEPQLSAEQVVELEEKIGEGLLEEVVEQGWLELECVKTLAEDKAWEPLAVVPEEGQWEGFRGPSAAS